MLNSDAVHRGAYSALYPQITASYGQSRSYQSANLFAPVNYSDAYNQQLTISQLIFNGFATKGNIDQTRAQLNLSFANLDAEKAVISFNLKTAFAQLIYAQKLIKISRDVIDIRQSNARLVNLLYQGGSEDRGNTDLSQANLDQALFSLDQALRLRDLSGIQLSVSCRAGPARAGAGRGRTANVDLAGQTRFPKAVLNYSRLLSAQGRG